LAYKFNKIAVGARTLPLSRGGDIGSVSGLRDWGNKTLEKLYERF